MRVRRASLAGLAIFAIALLTACGGSGDRTGSIGEATVTVPSGVSGVTGELKAILDQFPYQHWYTACVVKRFEGALGPGEEESLADLSEADREARINQIIAKVSPACEESTDRPLVDPNATSQELDLLRAELVPTMKSLAEDKGLDSSQTECLTRAFENLPDEFIVTFGNGNQKTRSSILLTVLKSCAEAG